MIYDVSDSLLTEYTNEGNYEGFRLELIRLFAMECPITQKEFLQGKTDELTQKLYESARESYANKCQMICDRAYPVIRDVYDNNRQTIENIVVPFSDGTKGIQVIANLKKAYESRCREIITEFEKAITLIIIDDAWKEHLREMDDLKQSVQNAIYEQKDPLLVYKFESFELFKQMLDGVNKEIISFLYKGIIPDQGPQDVQEARAPQHTDMSRMKANKASAGPGYVSTSTSEVAETATAKREPVKAEVKVGRNDPCPCGSGKKYKNCHGANE
jgi:preprotein translocase subunit SecA